MTVPVFRLGRVRFAVAIALAGASVLGHAADFQVNPRVEVGGLYNDNIRLDEVKSRYVEVAGGFVDAAVEFRNLSPLTDIRLTPRVRSSYYPGDDDENSNDLFLNFGLDHRFEKAKFSVRAEASQQDTVNSEVPLADIDPDASLGGNQGVDAGYLDVQNERTLVRINPELELNVTERSRLAFLADLTDVGYDKAVPGRQIGYSDYGLTARYRYSTSSRSTWSVLFGASRYEPDGDLPQSDALRAAVEWTQRASENQEFYLRAGATETEVTTRNSPALATTTQDTGVAAAAGVRWYWVRSRLFVDLTHDVAPTSVGLTAERTEGRFWYSYDLSPTLTAYAVARGVKEEDQGTSLLAREREYFTLGGRVEWRFRRDLTLGGRVDFVSSTDRGDADSAEANSVSIWLRWQPPRRDK